MSDIYSVRILLLVRVLLGIGFFRVILGIRFFRVIVGIGYLKIGLDKYEK